MIEPLEPRQLLSAALANGLLSVTGTTGNDEIFIKAEGSKVRVDLNGTSDLFDRAQVTQIAVFAGDGDDHILLRNISVPAVLAGGAGSDTISAGSADDTLIGEAGVDYLYGREGSDIFDGGAGRDRLIGGDGDDIAVPMLDRLTSIEKNPNTELVERSFPHVAPKPTFGVVQNNDGTTTLQVQFPFTTGGWSVFYGPPRINGTTINLDATVLFWSGAVTEALDYQTHEFNLGRLGNHVSYTVQLKQSDGAMTTTTLSRETSNPVSPYPVLVRVV